MSNEIKLGVTSITEREDSFMYEKQSYLTTKWSSFCHNYELVELKPEGLVANFVQSVHDVVGVVGRTIPATKQIRR